MENSPHLIKVGDLIQQTQWPLALSGEYTYEDLPSVGTIHSAFAIRKSALGFVMDGTIDAELVFVCDRCLAPVNETVHLDVDEEFVLESRLNRYAEYDTMDAETRHLMKHAGKNQEVQLECFYETVGDSDTLDLRDITRQWLVMETTGQHTCPVDGCAAIV